MRFERMTLWLKVKCSTCWANGTQNINLVALARFELTNATVKVWCLTAWLQGSNITKWWRDMDLNHGTRRNRFTVCRVWPLRYPSKKKMVPKTGIEPVTYWLQVSCSTNWAISANNKWWAIQDSNLWPPACKADALTNWANRPIPSSVSPTIFGTRFTDN